MGNIFWLSNFACVNKWFFISFFISPPPSTYFDWHTELIKLTVCFGFTGSTEALGALETVMEHIAKQLNKDPVQVKMINKRSATDLPFPAMVEDIKKSSDFDRRVKEIETFNKVRVYSLRKPLLNSWLFLNPIDYFKKNLFQEVWNTSFLKKNKKKTARLHAPQFWGSAL